MTLLAAPIAAAGWRWPVRLRRIVAGTTAPLAAAAALGVCLGLKVLGFDLFLGFLFHV